ncbi:MAG: 5'/3'-nucleotidase SurE [Myxococcota bacterium]
MRVLVTNDDGVHAPGMAMLADAAREVFSDVTVVAPLTEQSGVSQALSLHRPLRLEDHGDDRWSVDGTPVDAVFVALAHVMKGRRPDLVLSGLNHGPNVGYDIYYSGTVGAAREGLIHGVPSAAFSLSSRAPFDFVAVRPILVEVLRRLREHGLPAETMLNVNVPRVQPDAPPGWLGLHGVRGLVTTTLGRRYYGNEVVHREDPRGRPYFWIGGAWPRMEHIDGTDCEAVRHGWVSVTPLGLDATHRPGLEHLTTHFSDRAAGPVARPPDASEKP